MSFDKNKIIFKSKLFSVVSSFNAAITGEESVEFVDKLYEEYQLSAEKDLVGWLKERLKDQFLYIDQPPIWVEDEPTWAFHDGKPMIFISQYAIPETDLTKEKLTYDETVYTFGIRIPGTSEGGFDMLYKTIVQTSWQ